MPIDKSNYPKNWDRISLRIRKERARDRCECTGQCDLHKDRCEAVNTHPHPITESTVVLTVAHLDQNTWNNRDDNLLAMCQRCHLVYDRRYYKKQRLAWVKTLDDTDLDVLFAALENYSVDVIGKYFNSKAKSIWGKNYIDSLDEITTLLQAEWDVRHQPPLDMLDE